MSIEEPVVVIALEKIPFTIPPPHTLLGPDTLSNLHELQQLPRPIYLILPCVPLDSFSSATNSKLLFLATATPPACRITLLFLDHIRAEHALCYQALFNAFSLTAHSAKNVLSSLHDFSHRRTPLSIALPQNSVLRDLVLTYPSTATTSSLTLPDNATLVAVGASLPPTQTLSTIPGFKLSFIPSEEDGTPIFLSSLKKMKLSFLLRFPDDSHLFVHSVHHTWDGILLLPFPLKAISCLDPVTIGRGLKHPPRVPIHRPLLRLPLYHKPPTTPPNFGDAVLTVAHRTHPEDAYQPPSSTAITALDMKILSQHIKHTTVKQSPGDLKLQRFNRLHARATSNPKRPAQSVIKAPRKRLKTSYFRAALSAVLAPLSDQPKFYDHPFAPVSWKEAHPLVYGDDAENYEGFHAVEFCEQTRDVSIQACESLIGKSAVEFAVGRVDRTGARKIKYASAALCRNAIGHELRTESLAKEIKLPKSTNVETRRNPHFTGRIRRDQMIVLPS